jgi:hypothetical protein
MVPNSHERLHALDVFIFHHVTINWSLFEVSNVKKDGTVFVKFKSGVRVSASELSKLFLRALESTGYSYTQPDDVKFRLPITQF